MFPDVTATLVLTRRKREHQKYPFGVIAASGAELWLKSLRIGSVKMSARTRHGQLRRRSMILAVFRTRPKS